jgi:hypothetical protein
MPSFRACIADVGQAVTQGAFAHWLQRVTWKERRALGKTPTSTDFTYVRLTPTGTSFSLLHAVEQAWQPMQRVWSMTLAQTGSEGVDAAVVSCTRGW